MKVVLDPIHGYIELDDFVQELLSTPQMQRLRRVRQLGFSNLVYPGANHNRFEHSLGTMNLASMLTKNLDSIEDDKKTEIKIASLLHDIGHGPFSHVTENIIDKYTRNRHDDLKEVLVKGEIGEILKNGGFLQESLQNTSKGKPL